MKRYQLLIVGVPAWVVGGCASMDVQSGDQRETTEERTYVTGSHLPVRNGTSSKTTTTDSKAFEDAMRRGNAPVPAGIKGAQ